MFANPKTVSQSLFDKTHYTPYQLLYAIPLLTIFHHKSTDNKNAIHVILTYAIKRHKHQFTQILTIGLQHG